LTEALDKYKQEIRNAYVNVILKNDASFDPPILEKFYNVFSKNIALAQIIKEELQKEIANDRARATLLFLKTELNYKRFHPELLKGYLKGKDIESKQEWLALLLFYKESNSLSNEEFNEFFPSKSNIQDNALFVAYNLELYKEEKLSLNKVIDLLKNRALNNKCQECVSESLNLSLQNQSLDKSWQLFTDLNIKSDSASDTWNYFLKETWNQFFAFSDEKKPLPVNNSDLNNVYRAFLKCFDIQKTCDLPSVLSKEEKNMDLLRKLLKEIQRYNFVFEKSQIAPSEIRKFVNTQKKLTEFTKNISADKSTKQFAEVKLVNVFVELKKHLETKANNNPLIPKLIGFINQAQSQISEGRTQ
jgi:hypothetical protein